MQKDKIVVGLDIGTTKICAIVGRQNEFDKLEILGMGKAVSEGVFAGKVINIDMTIGSIRKAIREAEEQSGIDIKVVNVGIAGHHIKSSIHHGGITRSSNENEISVEDVNRLTHDMYKTVIPPGNQIIHVMPQDYTVDYEGPIMDPVGMSGVKMEADFHIITADTGAISRIKKCIEKSGLEIDDLILEPIASSMSVLEEDEKEAGVVLVDIGGGTTDIAIFHENILRHTAVIPFGGNIITADIKQGCQVLQNQAELLKLKFGRALAEEVKANEIVSIPGLRGRQPKEISIKNLAFIIQSRLEEIIDQVHSQIINSGYENKLGGGIVLTGGGSQLQNIKQLFEYMTGKDVRIGHPNQYLGKGKIEEVKSPMYATSVGLVLAGFKSLDERENRYLELGKAAENNNTNARKKTPKPEDSGVPFMKKISNSVKSFLIDDLEDKNDY
jgi:cell division protein FtsA